MKKGMLTSFVLLSMGVLLTILCNFIDCIWLDRIGTVVMLVGLFLLVKATTSSPASQSEPLAGSSSDNSKGTDKD